MASFTGFPPATFAFLRELAANNDRTWFAANKTTYEKSVLAPFHLLLADVISALAEKGIRLGGDPKKAIFRVHRDVRFSKEKLPYKTHAGAVLTRDGVKGASGILYLHIDPEGCFLAAGFHAPGPEQLGAIREAIYIDPPRFQAVRAGLMEAGLTLDASETLSRMPRDYQDAADLPVADALRLKRFVVRRAISEALVGGPGLVSAAVRFAVAVWVVGVDGFGSNEEGERWFVCSSTRSLERCYGARAIGFRSGMYALSDFLKDGDH